MRDRFGVDVQAMHGDDGIVLRLPDGRTLDELDGVRERGVGREPARPGHPSTPTTCVAWSPRRSVARRCSRRRFRECAARALLLPRRRPDRRQPLWQQRQRASQLLEVASQYPTFPIVLEGRPRVRAGRLRRARAGRPDARHRLAQGHRGRRREQHALAVRQVAAVRLRRAVPLRGRLPAGRASRGRPGARPQPARRAARHQRGAGAARPARRRADRPHRGRAATAHSRAGGPRRRRRARPAPFARAAAARRHPGPLPRGHHRRRRRGLAGRAARRPAGHRGAGRGGGPVVGHRRRVPAARRPRGLVAARCAAGLPRAGA